MKLIAQIEQRLQAPLSVVSVFQHPTIEQMAQLIGVPGRQSTALGTMGEMDFEEGAIGAEDFRAVGGRGG